MKTDFFKSMKDYILEEFKDDRNFLLHVRHFETLFQNKEILKPLLNDMETWKLDIHHQEDRTEGYTDGKYLLYLWDYVDDEPEEDDVYGYYEQKRPDYHYEIELTRDERYWGYCDCEPEDPEYNPEKTCCGNGCDWAAPSFTLSKVQEWQGNFKGVERDLWALEEGWSEHLNEYKEKVKRNKLDRIEEQMERLRKEKEELTK